MKRAQKRLSHHTQITVAAKKMQKQTDSREVTNKNNGMLLRGPSWASGAGGSSKHLIVTHDDDDDIMSTKKNSGENSTGGTMSLFQDSFSSFGSAFRGAVDSAIGSLKDNVDSEIVAEPTFEETRRDHALKVEKDASIAHIMGDDEFRRFKKEMHATGMVTSGAINQNISKHIGKRASLDMNPRQKSSLSPKSQARAASLDMRHYQQR